VPVDRWQVEPEASLAWAEHTVSCLPLQSAESGFTHDSPRSCDGTLIPLGPIGGGLTLSSVPSDDFELRGSIVWSGTGLLTAIEVSTRYLHLLTPASLWLVLSQRPQQTDLIEYLEGDRDVRVLWRAGDTFAGPSWELLRKRPQADGAREQGVRDRLTASCYARSADTGTHRVG
jgi:hypothetical protein